ncbi:hypothetical protein N9760_04080 [Schleiferiaceae bacterium]|nr:hypothetical protein [Schleiferiaceae bacterium]
MKIKEIANNIELHKAEDGLALMANNKVLLQGFTDIGTLANGLVPVIYYMQQQFKYLDTDTLEIFDISNVNWISGFHYVGSNLTYLGHNYRTDPRNKLSVSYKYSSVEGMKSVFENLDGCEMMLKPERKFNEDLQKMLETGVNKMQCTLAPELAQKLFNEIKYYRIVGKGFLAKGLDIGSRPIKLEDGSNYNSSLFTLSQKDETYGVIDVRTNKLITEIIHKEIDVCPKVIRVDTELFFKY